jgi:hypothetical protein
MRIRRLLVIAGLAASLVAVGGTAASASTTNHPPFRFGQEHFVLTTRSPSNTPTYRAVAFGVFNGVGVFRTVSNTSSKTVLIAHIAGGSFWVTARHNGSSKTALNPFTCRVTFTSSGNTYKIKNGTGRLWGLVGFGTYSIFSVQTVPRWWPGGPCNFKAPPVRGSTFTVIRANGPVFLPFHRFY